MFTKISYETPAGTNEHYLNLAQLSDIMVHRGPMGEVQQLTFHFQDETWYPPPGIHKTFTGAAAAAALTAYENFAAAREGRRR
jgi:hypothetical protein